MFDGNADDDDDNGYSIVVVSLLRSYIVLIHGSRVYIDIMF